MNDEINHVEQAQAEIEQGRRYRSEPFWKRRPSKGFWLAVMCGMLFIDGLRSAIKTQGTRIDFNYWNPSGDVQDQFISTVGVCLWAAMLIWLISDWKLRVRA